MKVFSKVGLPETAVNARKIPFMTKLRLSAFMVINKKTQLSFSLSLHQTGSRYFLLTERSIGHVEVYISCVKT